MDTEWDELNTLLHYLHSFDVVKLVDEHYSKLGNYTPAKLLAEQTEKVRYRQQAKMAKARRLGR